MAAISAKLQVCRHKCTFAAMSSGLHFQPSRPIFKWVVVLQMWERKLDTKALMAWNDNTVVLSFRGTASFRNVLADLKVSNQSMHVPAVFSCRARVCRSPSEMAMVTVSRSCCLSSDISEAQAWYAVHPPKRGKMWTMSRPFVHQVTPAVPGNSSICAACLAHVTPGDEAHTAAEARARES